MVNAEQNNMNEDTLEDSVKKKIKNINVKSQLVIVVIIVIIIVKWTFKELSTKQSESSTRQSEIVTKQLETMNIALGMNKDVVDEVLNKPLFEQNKHNIIESVYVLENEIVRGYYENNNLVAYFITITNTDENEVMLPTQYQNLVNNKKLGSFTYSEIEQMPSKINSYVTNGIGYTFYSETYYFGSFGGYNDFYFLHLQYGLNMNSYINDFDEFCADPEVTKDNLGEVDQHFVVDRKNSYPNTYGICKPKYSDK